MEVELGISVPLRMALIPAGEFLMGSPETEEGRYEDEGPPHRVRIAKPFYLGIYQVTQEQYEAVMGENPSFFKGAKHPVERVSWGDAAAFCRKVSEKTGETVRLPTEAEWEYACRAGEPTPWNLNDVSFKEKAWHDRNARGRTHPVGELKPNRWGLYDMHGNVCEWCQDWYGAYQAGEQTDPRGPDTGDSRVLRGGAWNSDPTHCRSALRDSLKADDRDDVAGFRVAVDVR